MHNSLHGSLIETTRMPRPQVLSEDIHLLKQIRVTLDASKISIVDARSLLNAKANQVWRRGLVAQHRTCVWQYDTSSRKGYVGRREPISRERDATLMTLVKLCCLGNESENGYLQGEHMKTQPTPCGKVLRKQQ